MRAAQLDVGTRRPWPVEGAIEPIPAHLLRTGDVERRMEEVGIGGHENKDLEE